MQRESSEWAKVAGLTGVRAKEKTGLLNSSSVLIVLTQKCGSNSIQKLEFTKADAFVLHALSYQNLNISDEL